MPGVTFRRLPVANLLVDIGYQREIDPRHVKRIAKDFNEHRFGALEVAQRNGKFAVWDGQHRLEAAKIVGLDTVPCLVHKGVDTGAEADLFAAQKVRKSIHPIETFKARLFAGDDTAREIEAIVAGYGFVIAARSGSEAGRQHAFGAVGTIERLHKKGMLAPALDALRDLWYGDEKSTDAGLLEALADTIAGYGSRFNEEARAKLRNVAPVVILRRANAAGMGGKGAKQQAIAQEIRRAAGLRGRPVKLKRTGR